MTLVQIRHFLALAEAGSFRKAAAAVHLTQPALSRSIQALEGELGEPLFDRIGWRNELTPFGTEVLQRARRVLLDLDDLQDSAGRLRDARSGRLRVGLGSGPGALLTTPLLLQVAEAHRGLQLEVARGSTARLTQALRERSLDALVIDARSLNPAPDLHCETMGEMRGAFLCRPGHPLLQGGRPVRFDALSAYGIAATPLSDEVARVLVERYGPEAHPTRCVTLRCEDVASLADVSRRTDVVLLAIRAAAPDLVELETVPRLEATARFALVTLAGRSAPPSLSLLRAMARQRLLDDPAPVDGPGG